MAKQKSQIGEHLDPRADSYFSYDKKEQYWVIATTWHVFLHKVGDPDEHYETRHFRAPIHFAWYRVLCSLKFTSPCSLFDLLPHHEHLVMWRCLNLIHGKKFTL